MKKLIPLIACDIAQIVVAIYATIGGYEWARNIIYFFSGFITIASLGLFLQTVKEKQKEQWQKSTFRRTSSRITDTITILLLASHGFWWCATATLTAALMLETPSKNNKKPTSKCLICTEETTNEEIICAHCADTYHGVEDNDPPMHLH